MAYHYPADRGDVLSMEAFPSDKALPLFANFLPWVKTDFHRWSYDLDWTLESGPDEAPDVTEICVPYNYRGPTPDSWAEPGDAAELEIGTPWFVDANGVHCEVSLTDAEHERVEAHIHDNPPDDRYDYDY